MAKDFVNDLQLQLVNYQLLELGSREACFEWNFFSM
jgi:hypothetical protein